MRAILSNSVSSLRSDWFMRSLTPLPASAGYTDAKGLLSARQAVMQYYRSRDVPGIDVENVFLGNGVSELIVMAMTALLESGDEVLFPLRISRCGPPQSASTAGGPFTIRCDESSDWYPDVADMAAKVTARTRAIVIINPNNPTGAVYPPEVLTADPGNRAGAQPDRLFGRDLRQDPL